MRGFSFARTFYDGMSVFIFCPARDYVRREKLRLSHQWGILLVVG